MRYLSLIMAVMLPLISQAQSLRDQWYTLSSRYWTPSNMTVTTWYDASDTNTLTFVSGNRVSQWRTKAGATKTLLQGTTANRPTYINNYIWFDGTNDALAVAGFNSVINVTVFTVSLTYSNSAVIDLNKALYQNKGAPGNPDFWGLNPTHNDTQGTGTIRTDASSLAKASVAVRGIAHIRAFTSYTAASNGLNRIDGGAAEDVMDTVGLNMQNGTGRTLTVGNQKGVAERYFQGNCYEMIFITSRLMPTDSDYLKIEGYLAWKWNLVGNLPANHPYKTDGTLFGYGIVPSGSVNNLFEPNNLFEINELFKN